MTRLTNQSWLKSLLQLTLIVGLVGTVGCLSAPKEEAEHHDPEHLPESFALGVERLRTLYAQATGDQSLVAVEPASLHPKEADRDPVVHSTASETEVVDTASNAAAVETLDDDHELVSVDQEANDLWGWLPDLAAETDLKEADWNLVRDATSTFQKRAEVLALGQLEKSPEARAWWHDQLQRLIVLANRTAASQPSEPVE